MTREEAIKEAYGIPVTKAQHEALQFLIPELAENDDERIRKSLLDFLDDVWHMGKNANFNKWGKADCADWISYIEKQKEQKSLSISAASEWLRKHVCRYINSEYNEFHKCVEYDGSIDKERLINDFEEAMQKEQKPWKVGANAYFTPEKKTAEWNPTNEDVILFNKAVTTNTTLTSDERAKLDIIRMKFKHRPVIKQQEQKPVQTAKEAWKEMRLEAYAQASGNRHEPNYSDDSTKMFSLCDIDEIFEKIGNYTVEQKPVWSEEDERMLRRCIKSVESSKNFAETQTFKEAKDKEKEWLILLPEKFNQYPIEDCDYGLEIALDILVKTLKKVQGYQTDDGIREHQTAIQAVKDAMKPWSYPYGKNETVDKLIAIAECLEMDGDCMFNGISGDDCGKFLRDLARKEVE